MKLMVHWWDGARPHNADWWDNFSRGLIFRDSTERAERLAEWGAVWKEDHETWSRWLEFENETDATIFLLRWS